MLKFKVITNCAFLYFDSSSLKTRKGEHSYHRFFPLTRLLVTVETGHDIESKGAFYS